MPSLLRAHVATMRRRHSLATRDAARMACASLRVPRQLSVDAKRPVRGYFTFLGIVSMCGPPVQGRMARPAAEAPPQQSVFITSP